MTGSDMSKGVQNVKEIDAGKNRGEDKWTHHGTENKKKSAGGHRVEERGRRTKGIGKKSEEALKHARTEGQREGRCTNLALSLNHRIFYE
jgi:hypothetical protein